jgi:general secretion pathway protein D
VVLDIEQEVSSVAPSSLVASDIITNERKILTKVMASNGRVIVLGGLIKDDVQETEEKVPLLGDIPFLGRLFRNDSVSVNKTNLMVFIRSTVIRDDEELAGATGEKYRYIREQQERQREAGLPFLDDDYLPVMPEWEAQIQQLEEIKAESADADRDGSVNVYGPGSEAGAGE